MRAILMSHYLWGAKSEDSTHKLQPLKRRESRSWDSNQRHPRTSLTPYRQLGQTGSRSTPCYTRNTHSSKTRPTDRQTDRQRQRQRDRDTETEKDRQTETETKRDRERQTDRETETDREQWLFRTPSNSLCFKELAAIAPDEPTFCGRLQKTVSRGPLGID